MDNACVFPQAGGCTDALIGVACDGPAGADGEPMAGVCFGSPLGTLCVPGCDPLDVDSCTTERTLCQPLGALGDPATTAICIPDTLGCSTPADCPTVSMPAAAVSVFHHPLVACADQALPGGDVAMQ